jgi:hypothetical protein
LRVASSQLHDARSTTKADVRAALGGVAAELAGDHEHKVFSKLELASRTELVRMGVPEREPV